MVEVTNMKW